MRKSSRSERRHNTSSKYATRKKQLEATSSLKDGHLDTRKGKMWIKTMALCSCPMCGNPRKWFSLDTRQEMKQQDIFHDQLVDVEDSFHIS